MSKTWGSYYDAYYGSKDNPFKEGTIVYHQGKRAIVKEAVGLNTFGIMEYYIEYCDQSAKFYAEHYEIYAKYEDSLRSSMYAETMQLKCVCGADKVHGPKAGPAVHALYCPKRSSK